MKKEIVASCILCLFFWGCSNTPEMDASVVSQNTIDIDVQDVKTSIQGDQKKVSINPDIPDSDLQLTSSAFQDGDSIPMEHTCEGDNAIPPLAISGVPEGTKSLMLIMSNPHYHEGKFVHWSVWNLHPKTMNISPEILNTQRITQGINDFGTFEYEGPCPNKGKTENYIFELWALDTTITRSVPEWTAGHLMINTMGHILGKTTLETQYSR
jgi:Raf kinase inhibitor-like YbhB/YbcL family protein